MAPSLHEWERHSFPIEQYEGRNAGIVGTNVVGAEGVSGWVCELVVVVDGEYIRVLKERI